MPQTRLKEIDRLIISGKLMRIKIFVIATAMLLLPVSMPYANVHATPTNHPIYNVVHGWPILPDGESLGSVSGVGVDSHGNVFVFHRANRMYPTSDILELTPITRPTVDVFNGQTGVLINRWGDNLFSMPHGLTIDDHDNVWLTDIALQQVYKFSPDGHLLLTLGERGVAGDDSAHFNRPTAVAVSKDGSFYVSDGYRNSRVMKFSADGKFLFQWGTKGDEPTQFNIPHWITLDSAGNVYVADRENSRIQIFDASGRYLSQWSGKKIGRPYAIAIANNGDSFIADGGEQPRDPPDRSAWVIVGVNGVPITRVGQFGNHDGQFEMAHTIAIDASGAVYVGDITGRRVQKFVTE